MARKAKKSAKKGRAKSRSSRNGPKQKKVKAHAKSAKPRADSRSLPQRSKASRKPANVLRTDRSAKTDSRNNRNKSTPKASRRSDGSTKRASPRSKSKQSTSGRTASSGRNARKIAELQRRINKQWAESQAALAKKDAAIRQRDEVIREYTRSPKEGRHTKLSSAEAAKERTPEANPLPKKYRDTYGKEGKSTGGIKLYTGPKWSKTKFNADTTYTNALASVGESDDDDLYGGTDAADDVAEGEE